MTHADSSVPTIRYTSESFDQLNEICIKMFHLEPVPAHQDPRIMKYTAAIEPFGVTPAEREAYNSITDEQWYRLYHEFDRRNEARGDAPMTYFRDIVRDLFPAHQADAYVKIEAAHEKLSQALWDCEVGLAESISEKGHADIPAYAAPQSERSR